MAHDKIPISTTKQIIIITTIISVIVGGFVGGVSGVFLAGWSVDGFWPKVINSLGFELPGKAVSDGSQLADEKVVVEDSATTKVVENASPAVVSIVVKQDLSEYYNRTGRLFPFEEFFFGSSYQEGESGKMRVGGGTGFVITTDGMIITNRHVVNKENAEYTVVTNDGSQHEAEVLARDELNDIAILKIQADNLPVLDMGNSDQIKIGQTVIAIGNSLGEYKNTVTKGVVSGINRRVVAGGSFGYSEVINEAIQTDAAINPGNSGGPLIDLFGKVIGVNTAVSQEGQLIGFAIPINSVKNIVESVREHGRIVRPFLGVRYILLNEEIAKSNDIQDVDHGALIVRGSKRTDLAVVPGSPADKNGIVENDIILEVNGEEVTLEKGLARIIAQYKPGDTVTLKVYHRDEEREISVKLSERK